jgi:hypothetical protein
VGYYYDSGGAPPEEKPPGCLDAVLITRAVFGILLWPMLGIALVLADVGAIFFTFTIHPALALIPLVITAAALWLFAKWEQSHFRPPGL